MSTAREAFTSWLERSAPELIVAALLIVGAVAGWYMRGEEHVIAGRCHAPSGVSIVRDGGDIIVRCAP